MQCWNFCLMVRVCVCSFNCSVVSNALQPFGLFHGASCLFQVILVLKQGNIHQNGVVFSDLSCWDYICVIRHCFIRINFLFCHRSSPIVSEYPPPPQMTMGMLLRTSYWFLSFWKTLPSPCHRDLRTNEKPTYHCTIICLHSVHWLTLHGTWGQMLGLERDREPLPAGFTFWILDA